MSYFERIKRPGVSLEVRKQGLGYVWMCIHNHETVGRGFCYTKEKAWRLAEECAKFVEDKL